MLILVLLILLAILLGFLTIYGLVTDRIALSLPSVTILVPIILYLCSIHVEGFFCCN